MATSPLIADETIALTPEGASRRISIGRDAVGNVLVNGEGNNVQVTLIVADERLISASISAGAIDNPYRGLDAFREVDSAWFFGQTKLIRRTWVLFQKLQRGADPRILAIVGASGSGKSSLVRAGLVPELAREPMDGLESPKILVLRPGLKPLYRLAEVLAQLHGATAEILERLKTTSSEKKYDGLYEFAVGVLRGESSRIVIVIDQFEEVFTECEDATSRIAFLENLAYAASVSDKIVSVIITLRSDFVGTIKTPLAFATAVRENKVFVQPMARDELREAIVMPARQLGYPWPQGLVENLVAQAEGRAGALPLLEFALKRLWADHVGGRLDEKSWSSRLIEDFLVQAADVLYESAGQTASERTRDQNIIRQAFVAMVQLGEGVADTRRVARLSEFVADGEDVEHVRAVLSPFTAPEARLSSVSEQGGEPVYELTHEALIGSWDRLRNWLGNVADRSEAERIRRNLRLHRKLSAAATEWKAGTGNLLSQLELKQLEKYAISSDETAFIRASRIDARRRKFVEMALAAAVVIMAGGIAIRYGYAEYVTRTALECDLFAAERDNVVGVPGVEYDRIIAKKAIPACESAVRSQPDNPRLMHNLGRSYDAAGRYKEANFWYTKAVALGWAWSQNNLGENFLAGRGVTMDFAKAVPLLRAAAERGAGQAGAEDAVKQANINYARSDYTSWFDDPAFASILEKALITKGFLDQAKAQKKWNPKLSDAVQAFKKSAILPEKGVTLRVLDQLGVVGDFSDMVKLKIKNN
jgi:TPR repeat protein